MSEWLLPILLVLLMLLASVLIAYPLRKKSKLLLFLLPMVWVSVAAGYYCWGGFAGYKQFVQNTNRQIQAKELLKTVKDPRELIEKLRAKLDDTPRSAKGWYLLGKLYSSQAEHKKAATAFAKAYQFQPDDEQFAVYYAHSMWILNNQQFNEQIKAIFNDLLKKNPNQPDALAMLAMDSFLAKHYQEAIDYWQRLLKMAPAQSEEAQSIRKAIAKAQEQLK